eukprot:scaffold1786_cov138-Cylindrotheca_fusiformis.AAC.6
MSKPELLYFDFAGRGEPVRILFHIAGVDYTDTRVGKEWPTIKPTTPLGFMPVLKVGDTQYCQSVSLARYAAKLAGWYPADDLEALKCDMVAESINEVMDKAPMSKDPEELKKLRQEFQKGTLTNYCQWIEGIIQGNGGTLVAGKSPTYADLVLAGFAPMIQSGFFDHIDTNFLDGYPGILATTKAVMENDKVKAYQDSKK